ncbi:E3 ubiquitin-protein ligase TRIM23-like isoform X2 [Artemia franciscana]|uniref:RING-type E3 ubiquitin transferase n=1 Tax=Artemia franciscana TaxID=6661 RepID=A0AA88L3V2_ARTSF|nr:hypothetical protein QYM36_012762 [Artemia franciscana]
MFTGKESQKITSKGSILECKVCDEAFAQQGEHVPRLLQCGHTVCHSCLMKLPTQDVTLLCPFDRQETILGPSAVWSLKKNFALLELLEKLQIVERERNVQEATNSHSSYPGPSIACDEEETHVASVFCTVCLTNLCAECSDMTHNTRTLMKHLRIPVSERPRQRPKCQYHSLHFVEFVCLEKSCVDSPLCCFICKDYGRHKGHMHGLIETEAEKLRLSVASAISTGKDVGDRLQESIRKLETVASQFEGSSAYSPPVLTETVTIGSAEAARLHIQAYFRELHDMLNMQENAALLTVDSYIREKLCFIRQNHEDLSVVVSQISEICQELEKTLQADEIQLAVSSSAIATAIAAIDDRQSEFSERRLEQLQPDASIPITFTKNNRVQIGPKVEARVITLGLDGAGKTSILFKLKQDEFLSTIPTIGFNVETIEYPSLKLTLWDVGGGAKLRPLWKHYYLHTQAVIFVVDSVDRDRFAEATAELTKIANEKELRNSALLILANKQDLPSAASVEEITQAFSLSSLLCGQFWHIQPCNVPSGTGLSEALQWLTRQLVTTELALS